MAAARLFFTDSERSPDLYYLTGFLAGDPFLFIEARAPHEVCRARLEARSRHVSDARADLLDDFAARWETADRLAPDQRLTVDTSAPLQDGVQAVQRRLDRLGQGRR